MYTSTKHIRLIARLRACATTTSTADMHPIGRLNVLALWCFHLPRSSSASSHAVVVARHPLLPQHTRERILNRLSCQTRHATTVTVPRLIEVRQTLCGRHISPCSVLAEQRGACMHVYSIYLLTRLASYGDILWRITRTIAHTRSPNYPSIRLHIEHFP